MRRHKTADRLWCLRHESIQPMLDKSGRCWVCRRMGVGSVYEKSVMSMERQLGCSEMLDLSARLCRYQGGLGAHWQDRVQARCERAGRCWSAAATNLTDQSADGLFDWPGR